MLPRKAWLACLTTLRASWINQGHLHVSASATREPSDACTTNASHRNQLRQGYLSWRLFRIYPWSAAASFLGNAQYSFRFFHHSVAIIEHFLPWIVFVNGMELWCVASKHLGTHRFTRTGRQSRIITVHKLELDALLPSIIALSTSSTEVFNRNRLSTSASCYEYDLPQVSWLLKQDRLAARRDVALQNHVSPERALLTR